MTDHSTKDLAHLLYDHIAAAAMRLATWISTQTGLFEGHPEYVIILAIILGAVWVKLS